MGMGMFRSHAPRLGLLFLVGTLIALAVSPPAGAHPAAAHAKKHARRHHARRHHARRHRARRHHHSVVAATRRMKDRTRPTAPANLTGQAGDQIVNLSWGASTDNVGVTGYRVSRGGTVVATVGATTLTYSDTAVQDGTSYTYTVSAFDASHNVSPSSNSVTLTPQASTSGGTTSGTGTTGTGTSATGTASAVDPSGVPAPVGDITGWHEIFVDDFSTPVPLGSFPSAVSSRWDAYNDGWKDTSGHGTYYCSKVCSVQNGMLDLYLHTENGVHMVAAPWPRVLGNSGGADVNGQLYGRYVIRFRADPVAGYKTAWLLWPDSGVWPRDGEIDFPEGNLNSTICAFMHRQNATSGSDQDAFCTQTGYTPWHTAETDWTPTSLKFVLDGVTIGTSTNGIPDTPMYWVIQTETALDGTVPSDSAAGHVQIDWVAVYRPA
jgi:Glycosyl hydrolases family 16